MSVLASITGNSATDCLHCTDINDSSESPGKTVEQTTEVTYIQQVRLGQSVKTVEVDALHIAVATVHGMHYLVTCNCTHIANATLRHRIEAVCRAAGYEPPTICTPQELLET